MSSIQQLNIFDGSQTQTATDITHCDLETKSILKPPKARAPLQDVNLGLDTTDHDIVRTRRVSFAGVNIVKEFHSKAESVIICSTPAYEETFSTSSDSSAHITGSCGEVQQTGDFLSLEISNPSPSQPHNIQSSEATLDFLKDLNKNLFSFGPSDGSPRRNPSLVNNVPITGPLPSVPLQEGLVKALMEDSSCMEIDTTLSKNMENIQPPFPTSGGNLNNCLSEPQFRHPEVPDSRPLPAVDQSALDFTCLLRPLGVLPPPLMSKALTADSVQSNQITNCLEESQMDLTEAVKLPPMTTAFNDLHHTSRREHLPDSISKVTFERPLNNINQYHKAPIHEVTNNLLEESQMDFTEAVIFPRNSDFQRPTFQTNNQKYPGPLSYHRDSKSGSSSVTINPTQILENIQAKQVSNCFDESQMDFTEALVPKMSCFQKPISQSQHISETGHLEEFQMEFTEILSNKITLRERIPGDLCNFELVSKTHSSPMDENSKEELEDKPKNISRRGFPVDKDKAAFVANHMNPGTNCMNRNPISIIESRTSVYNFQDVSGIGHLPNTTVHQTDNVQNSLCIRDTSEMEFTEALLPQIKQEYIAPSECWIRGNDINYTEENRLRSCQAASGVPSSECNTSDEIQVIESKGNLIDISKSVGSTDIDADKENFDPGQNVLYESQDLSGMEFTQALSRPLPSDVLTQQGRGSHNPTEMYNSTQMELTEALPTLRKPDNLSPSQALYTLHKPDNLSPSQALSTLHKPDNLSPSQALSTLHKPDNLSPSQALSTLHKPDNLSPSQALSTLHKPDNLSPSQALSTLHKPDNLSPIQALSTLHKPDNLSPSQALSTLHKSDNHSPSQTLPTLHKPDNLSPSQALSTLQKPDNLSPSQALSTLQKPDNLSPSQAFPTLQKPDNLSPSQAFPTLQKPDNLSPSQALTSLMPHFIANSSQIDFTDMLPQMREKNVPQLPKHLTFSTPAQKNSNERTHVDLTMPGRLSPAKTVPIEYEVSLVQDNLNSAPLDISCAASSEVQSNNLSNNDQITFTLEKTDDIAVAASVGSCGSPVTVPQEVSPLPDGIESSKLPDEPVHASSQAASTEPPSNVPERMTLNRNGSKVPTFPKNGFPGTGKEQLSILMKNKAFLNGLSFFWVSPIYWKYTFPWPMSLILKVPFTEVSLETSGISVQLRSQISDVDTVSQVIHHCMKKEIGPMLTEDWLNSKCQTINNLILAIEVIEERYSNLQTFVTSLKCVRFKCSWTFEEGWLVFHFVYTKWRKHCQVKLNVSNGCKLTGRDIRVVCRRGELREADVQLLFDKIKPSEKRLLHFVQSIEKLLIPKES